MVYFAAYPLGLRLIWTINILAGLIAPLLLMARSTWAVLTAIVAAAAQILLFAVTFFTLNRWEMLGATTAWFDIGIAALTAFFAGYCWAMRRRTFLR